MAFLPRGPKSSAIKVEGLANPSPSKEGLKSPGERLKFPKVLLKDRFLSNRTSNSSRAAVGENSKYLPPKCRDQARSVDDDQPRSRRGGAWTSRRKHGFLPGSVSHVTPAAAALSEEKPKLRKILEKLRARTKGLEDKVATLAARAAGEIAEDSGPRDGGGSFFAAKQTLLLSYCREICSYANAKATGRAIGRAGVPGRMLELRTVMEKLRPMDRKFKYQTDKLLGLGSAGPKSVPFSEGRDDDDDPLRFRPRPAVMAPQGGEADGADAQLRYGDQWNSSALARTREKAASGFYRAPRLSSLPYEGGVAVHGARGAARSENRLEKRQDKLRLGEVMESLREEFGEQPETVKASGNAGVAGVSEMKMKRFLDEDNDRLVFEEDHMIRLTVTRKSKKARAQMEKGAGRLETIADVGSAAHLVRAAKDADDFGVEMEGDEDDVFGGGRGRGSRGKKRGALERATGAAEESIS